MLGAILCAAGWAVAPAGADVVLNPVADSYARSDTPTTNYGTAKDIRVRGGGTLVINGYLKFQVSGMGPVSSAKLRVHVTDASPGTASVYTVPDDSWTESGLDVGERPGVVRLAARQRGRRPRDRHLGRARR